MDPKELSDISTFIPFPAAASSEVPDDPAEDVFVDAVAASPLSTSSSDRTSKSSISLPTHLHAPDDDTEFSSLAPSTSASTSCHSSVLNDSDKDSLTITTHAPANISFAPLPVIAPRKRRSSLKLGVAARSAIMRNRRALVDAQREEAGEAPLPPPAQVVQVRMLRATANDLWQDQERAAV
ncbi:hypothetical protein FIBSPDRAFT_962768, partial [Athelia psychrophila]